MSLASGLPYIGSRTENLTLSDPRCSSDACKAFYEAHQLSQAQVSYTYQYEYGHFTVYYYVAFIAVFTVVFWWRKVHEHRYSSGRRTVELLPSAVRGKFLAAWRSVAYRRVPGWASDRFGLPSMGMLLFLLLAVLYLAILTFAVRPYYRQHRGYGSPPLAVRTGLMAIALTPLLILLAGKANMVTLLTGVGHEKLNIVHRWVGWMTFILSVAHTVPFIVAPLKDGGYVALHKQFYKPGAFEYTGVPPLAILFGILLFSLPPIRHRVYEGFYHLHVWLATTYVGLMFWHAGQEGDSWPYLWATITAWLLSILARAFWFTRPTNIVASPWAIGSPLTAKLLPRGMTRIDIVAPDGFTWRPGQHLYLRIPRISPFDNHPFTIGSADKSCTFTTKEEEQKFEPRMISLYVSSHQGFTRRLRHHLESAPDAGKLQGWLEGPYGGHDRDVGIHFDAVLLVAGGSGISACLPWLEHLVDSIQRRERRPLQTDYVRLVWSVREMSAITWVADALRALNLSSPAVKAHVEVVVHVTRQNVLEQHVETPPALEEPLDIGNKEAQTTQRHLTHDGTDSTIRRGRIDMNALADGLPHGARTIVIGCGPPSFKVDLSNACASAQTMVLRGHLTEFYLWTETFGW